MCHDEPVPGSRPAGTDSGARPGPDPAHPGPGPDPVPAPSRRRPGRIRPRRPSLRGLARSPGAEPSAAPAASGAARAVALADSAGAGAGAEPGARAAVDLNPPSARAGGWGGSRSSPRPCEVARSALPASAGRWGPVAQFPAPSGRCLRRDLRAVVAPQGVERAVAVCAAVRVRAEEVALALGQGRRQPLRPQGVVIGERRRETGVGTPCRVAAISTSRQSSCASAISCANVSSDSRLGRSARAS